MKSLFVCSGDPSGDVHASSLVFQLKQQYPDLVIWGVGGPKMQEAGVDLLFNSQDFAVIGFANIIGKVPLFTKMRSTLLSEITKRKPDGILLVDFGGFNLNLAASVKKDSPEIPIVYFISPQIWGSRPWRVRVIAAHVTKMLTIFPFEETLYREKGVDAKFVGHPLTEKLLDIDFKGLREEFCAKNKLDPERPIIGIFPGSRGQEIKAFMPMILQAISWLNAERPELQFVLSQASPKIADHIYSQIDEHKKTRFLDSVLRLVPSEENHGLMASSDILWTKSGTTTLEAAFMERPMIIFYRGDWISYTLYVCVKTVQYIGWPNLLAGRMLVPELIQLDCRAEQLVQYTRDWLDVPAARTAISDELRSIKAFFRKGDFVANAAAELSKTLNLKAPQLEDATKSST